jgi:hypothetical protein
LGSNIGPLLAGRIEGRQAAPSVIASAGGTGIHQAKLVSRTGLIGTRSERGALLGWDVLRDRLVARRDEL